ncbi:bifunctional nuclease family protein [Synechococcus sp. H65.1]|uniref:bifunctional nuclease family protein n=1 Tax=unclassified Synechococcus TaxID=2626047 RepID=UPI0039C31677
MIEMQVAGIAVDAVNQNPIVILRDTHGRRALPIWVGKAEANAILQALDDQKPLRPMTHDLILNSWKAWGIKLERVIIHALLDNTFYAVLVTVSGDKKQEIDCRPSDGIALALRAHAPIWTVEEVIAEASIPMNQDADEAEREAFRKFVENVTPRDFIRHRPLTDYPTDSTTEADS